MQSDSSTVAFSVAPEVLISPFLHSLMIFYRQNGNHFVCNYQEKIIVFQFVIVTDWFIPHNPAFYIKIVNFYTIRQKFTLPNSFSILYFLHKRIAAILQLWTINHVGAINAATTTHIFCIISSVDFTRSIHVKRNSMATTKTLYNAM